MAKNEIFPDCAPEHEGADDVEILEVVGVDDEAEPFGALPEPSGLQESGEVEEYVLDLDDPGAGILADPPRAAPSGTAEDPNSDRTRLVRLRADYDNLRKRIDRERAEFKLNANLSLVGRLLPVLDNMDRALAAGASDSSNAALREGLVMIYKQLTDQLAEEGLQPVATVGQQFDPNLHDAVATESDTDAPSGTVLEEFQRGYLFRNRVLRPALVKVSTLGEDEASADAQEDS